MMYQVKKVHNSMHILISFEKIETNTSLVSVSLPLSSPPSFYLYTQSNKRSGM